MHDFDYSVPHFSTRIRGTHIVVTPDIVSEVLHVSRVAHPNYPSCERLKTVSKDELMSLFYETPSSWGDSQNTRCSVFAKGPRFLNMVMTFVLHPLSHYNSIIEPHARFLLSLLEHLTIDFSSHFILSRIDVYRNTVTHDKLIFPSSITRILCHFFFLLSCFWSFLCHVCHWCGDCQTEWGPASIEVTTNWDDDTSNFFNSIHIRSFFCERCYSWCDHGAVLAHGYLPWHFQRWVVSGEHLCQLYCMTTGSPWWLHWVSYSFSRDF